MAIEQDQVSEIDITLARKQAQDIDRAMRDSHTHACKFFWSHLILTTVGAILFSQGLSFMRWNQFSDTMIDKFNELATWVAFAGLALVASGVCLLSVNARLKRVEDNVAALSTRTSES